MLKMLDTFSGIGGFSLAAAWTGGIETVAFCEIETFCQKVLHKHWPTVPIHTDIKELNGRDLVQQHGAIDIICGGFPCQPFSCAGQRRGKDDDRYLWPEMLRVIAETRPTWVIGENVAGFVNMALDDCITDLESEGYEAQPFIIPACGVNAPHRRDRCWIVAHAECAERWPGEPAGYESHRDYAGRPETASGTGASSENGTQGVMAITNGAGCEEQHNPAQPGWAGHDTGEVGGINANTDSDKRHRRSCHVQMGGAGAREALKKQFTSREINGSLNPEWVSWLMGYPTGWLNCEDSETP